MEDFSVSKKYHVFNLYYFFPEINPFFYLLKSLSLSGFRESTFCFIPFLYFRGNISKQAKIKEKGEWSK
jgi:hypothetical protein